MLVTVLVIFTFSWGVTCSCTGRTKETYQITCTLHGCQASNVNIFTGYEAPKKKKSAHELKHVWFGWSTQEEAALLPFAHPDRHFLEIWGETYQRSSGQMLNDQSSCDQCPHKRAPRRVKAVSTNSGLAALLRSTAIYGAEPLLLKIK